MTEPTMENKTPLTDAEGIRFARLLVEWPELGKMKTTELLPADFARYLETKLIAAEQALERLRADPAPIEMRFTHLVHAEIVKAVGSDQRDWAPTDLAILDLARQADAHIAVVEQARKEAEERATNIQKELMDSELVANLAYKRAEKAELRADQATLALKAAEEDAGRLRKHLKQSEDERADLYYKLHHC